MISGVISTEYWGYVLIDYFSGMKSCFFTANQQIGIIAIMLVIAVYFIFDPSTDFFPTCPFLAVTGYQCPGCGAQRALHALLHLHIREAFVYNALLVIAIPYFFALYLFSYGTLKRKFPKIHALLTGWKTLLLLFVIIVAFGVLRNF